SGKELISFPKECAIGALLSYISNPERKDFQPMNISFGLIESYGTSPRAKGQSKEEKRISFANKALENLRDFVSASEML
ncbi:MAG: hypothetical protein GYA55_13240, partial [SAR324 cluster bacterium]|nr:hypothetical protein [SAR324 cluster bacterium]